MLDCPSDADLTGFLNESLPLDRISGVSAHVDGCASCQGRLDKLTHDTNGAIARFKDISSLRPTIGDSKNSLSEAGTLIVGANNLPTARLIGLPTVPGFDVLVEIGRGGMGVVYKARHRRLNRLVALKMVIAGGAADARVVQRFLYEAEILARVQHPQVVQVFEVDTYQGASGVPIPYLAMELLEGGSLSKRLRELRQKTPLEQIPSGKNTQLDPRVAAELIEGVARAVHAAHLQGVIHRDLKPGNILFPSDEFGTRSAEVKSASAGAHNTSRSESGTQQSALTPKVTDFGLAKFTQDSGADLTGSGQVVGTPHYMAPEQAAGSRQIGPTADVYALGAILFECLAGRPPFVGSEPMSVLLKVVNDAPPDVRALCRGLHQDLAAVVMRCLAKDPRRRYASAADLADDLRRYLEKRPTVARPVTMRERLWLWSKRNPAVAGLIMALGTVLFAAFIVITAFWVTAEQTARDERHAKDLARLAESRAINSQLEAAESLKEAERQKANADRNRTYLEFARAVTWCEEGRVAQGLDSFIRTAELAETIGAGDVAHVARVNLAAWPQVLPSDRKLFVQTHQPRDIAFSQDGRRGVVASRGANLFLWDTTTNQKIQQYRLSYRFTRYTPTSLTLGFTFWTIAISPDGKKVAAGGTDGQVWVWDTDKLDPLFTLEAAPPSEDVWVVAFAPDGTLWATNGGTGARQWDLVQKKSIAQIDLPGGSDAMIQSLIVSSDGKRLFTGDRGGKIYEWDIARKKPIGSWNTLGWVSNLALSPRDTHLAATGSDGFVRVIDLATKQETQRISLAAAYGKGLAFAPNRSLLVASDADGNVRGWDWKTGVPVGVPLRLSGEVLNPRFLPNSDEFVVPAGNAVYRCRMGDMPGQVLFPNNGIRVRGLDYSPTGDRLAVAHESILSEFDLASGKQSDSPLLPTATLTIRYDQNRNRNRLIRGYREGFDVIGLPGFTREAGSPNMDRVLGIEFTPGGTRMIAMDVVSLSLWDPSSFSRPLARYRDPDQPNGVEITAIDVRPDGRELLFAYANKVVFLNTETLEKSRPGWETADDILDAKYLPDGTRILVGRRDSVAEVLDTTTGAAIGRPLTHSRAALAVASSPDGRVLLTGSRDGMARFWDTATGLPLGPPLRHAGPVTHVMYNPNGSQVATGTGSGEVLLWAPPPAPIAGSLDAFKEARGMK